MIQRHAIVCSLALLSVGVTGCSSQPVAPSSVPAGSVASASPTDMSITASIAARGGRPASSLVVYVESQGLYYDSIVTADPLPMRGRFQELKMMPGPTTEFGPGDPGYLGGRWWVDVNGNRIQDEGDHFFSCPLLPPGRP